MGWLEGFGMTVHESHRLPQLGRILTNPEVPRLSSCLSRSKTLPFPILFRRVFVAGLCEAGVLIAGSQTPPTIGRIPFLLGSFV